MTEPRKFAEREARLAVLRAEIGEGVAEADRGELEPIDAIATLKRVRLGRTGGESREPFAERKGQDDTPVTRPPKMIRPDERLQA